MKKIYFLTILSLIFINCSENESDDVTPLLPSLDNISNLVVNAGDIITLNGQNLNPNHSYTLKVNEYVSVITEINPNYLKVEVPENAISGDIFFEFDQVITNIGYVEVQNIFTGDVLLLNQAAIEEFDYYNYTQVIGNIQIGEWNTFNQSITNLNGFNYLTSITGKLEILFNSSIQSINGFSSIQSVGSDLSIYDNNLLTNIYGFNSLTSIGGNFTIKHHDLLNDLNGFNNLTTIVGWLVVQNDDALANLDDFNSILNIGDYLVIFANDNLNNINGLNQLTSEGLEILIESNWVLNNINGLLNINSIDYLSIYDNPLLENVDGLENLSSLNNLEISQNYTLNNFCGLQGLLNNNGLNGGFLISQNAFNPTQQDIIDGNCSQ